MRFWDVRVRRQAYRAVTSPTGGRKLLMLPANPDRSAEMRPLIRTLGAKAYSSRTSHTPPAHRLDTQISPERVFCLGLDRARSRESTVIVLTFPLVRRATGSSGAHDPITFIRFRPPGGTVTEAGATLRVANDSDY